MALSSFSRSGLSRVSQIPSAVINGAATGTYTDSGITYNYYSFTGNGTLTVNNAGLADILVVGGGGGGGISYGGGGGGGGYIYRTDVYLAATAHTITVGGGGAGATGTSVKGSNGNISSIGGQGFGVPGGGPRSTKVLCTSHSESSP